MLFSYFSSIIQVLGEHLLSIVYLDSSESLLGEAPDYEVSHSEEQLLIAAHLLMVLTPLIHNRLQPEPLGQRVTALAKTIRISVLSDNISLNCSRLQTAVFQMLLFIYICFIQTQVDL